MKYSIKWNMLLIIILMSGCGKIKNTDVTIWQNTPVFAKGEITTSRNFTGTVWINMIGANDSSMHARIGNVTFGPGARTNWHSHPGGQILLVTQGNGYYQARGEPARLLSIGDYVEIPPNVVHWHGSTSDGEFAHIAISLNTDEGGVIWMNPVSDEEYINASFKQWTGK